VGGGIIAVLPGRFGIGVFSPRLDAKGNSVRGIEACKRLSRDFRLHVFNGAHSTSNTAIRVRYDAAAVRSRRQRPAEEIEVLKAAGARIQVFELQGDLRFGAAESIVQQILDGAQAFDSVVVDLKRVVELDHATREIFGRLAQAMAGLAKPVLFVHTREHYRFRKHLLRHFPGAERLPLLQFDDVDHALEWCEEELIRERMVQPVKGRRVDGCAEQYLCRGMTAAEIAAVESVARLARFAAGDSVFHAGDPADSFFLILSGDVDVYVDTGPRREVRLATLGAGSSFGELALLSERRRTADVRAASETECLEVRFDDLEEGVKTKLLLNLAGQLASRLERDARELRQLG
jgi:glutaminase